MKYSFLAALALVAEVSVAQSCKDQISNRISIPSATAWKVLTDQTERGGSSLLQVFDTPEGVKIEGSVGAIPGRNGPVGFAIARIPFQIKENTAGASLALSSDRGIQLTLVLTVIENLGMVNTVTYQNTISLKSGTQTIDFLWKDFKPSFRGQPQPEAPAITFSSVNSFALQVNRGNQPDEIRNNLDPIEFTFEVLK